MSTFAKGINAYADVTSLLDRALASPKGIEIEFGDPTLAYRKWKHCYVVRSRSRKALLRSLPPDHPQFGCSPYDQLGFQLKRGETVLRIVKLATLEYNLKEIE